MRGALTATYVLNPELTLAAAWRYSGRQYASLDNSDIDPNTFGGVSTVNQLDLKASWQVVRNVTVAAGVDNVNNQHAYQFHPYPLRTWVAELRVTH